MSSYDIGLIPGDGIGPEVVLAAKRCIESTRVKIEWEEVLAGHDAQVQDGKPT